MSAREAIFGKVRRSLGVGGDDTARSLAVEKRLGEAPRGIVPQRGQRPHAAQLDLFRTMAENVSASVARIGSYDDLPGEVARYLREKNLPASVRIGADPRLGAAGWDGERTLEIRTGPSDGSDLAGVSHAMAGIAETGTVALPSGADNPTTINFLPEHHIVVVDAADVVGDLETVWTRLRETYGKGAMPRALNLVTGPSRSGDIEQTILLGAHGPRALHLVIVG